MVHDFSIKSAGETIYGTIWEPEEKPKALVIFAHGITDFHSRYNDFFNHLNNSGVVVMGFDYPGHGRSEGTPRVYFGKNGVKRLKTILKRCIDLGKSRYENIPIILLGMSLGSYLVRSYLSQETDDRIDGVVLVGTGEMSPIELFIAKAIVKIEEIIYGDKAAPDLIQELAFGSYNQNFAPVRTAMDWLIKDPDELDLFMNSPYRGEKVTIGAFRDLLSLVSISCKKSNIRAGKKVPVLICSGKEDAVGGFGDKVKETYSKFEDAGYSVVLRLYENSRHDVLHDYDSEEAYSDISSWLETLKEV